MRRDLHVCVSVLNELKNTGLLDTASHELMVPVHSSTRRRLRLEPIQRCSFSDEEWVRQGEICVCTFLSSGSLGNFELVCFSLNLQTEESTFKSLF